MKKAAILISLFILLGCGHHKDTRHYDDIIGKVSMDQSGDLHVQIFDNDVLKDGYIVQKDSPSYEGLISQAGGVSFGEEKPLYRALGSVELLENQKIKVSYYAFEPGISFWPLVKELTPTDENYDAIKSYLNGRTDITITSQSGLTEILGFVPW